MPHTDAHAKSWQNEMAARFGESVQRVRKERGLSTVQLASRTKGFGYPIHRTAISKIENNSRNGKLDLAEVIVLAAALGRPPVELLYSGLADGEVEIWPDLSVDSFTAAQWFSGLFLMPTTVGSSNELIACARAYRAKLDDHRAMVRNGLERQMKTVADLVSAMDPPMTEDEVKELEQQARQGWLEQVRTHREQIEQMKFRIRELGGVVRDDHD